MIVQVAYGAEVSRAVPYCFNSGVNHELWTDYAADGGEQVTSLDRYLYYAGHFYPDGEFVWVP